MADLWHYTLQGVRKEPVSAAELKRLADAGQLQPTDLVWKEGMANWVKSSKLKGLFPTAAEATFTPATPLTSISSTPTAATRRPHADERGETDDESVDDAPRSESRRHREDPDSRRPAAKKSATVGWTILASVVGVLSFVVAGAIVKSLVAGLFSSAPSDFSVSLRPSTEVVRTFHFKAKVSYEIAVKSEKNTDVDVHIATLEGNLIAFDESIGPSSRLIWTPATEGRYQVKIRNLDPKQSNQSRVTIRTTAPADAKRPGAGPGGVVPAPQPKLPPAKKATNPPKKSGN